MADHPGQFGSDIGWAFAGSVEIGDQVGVAYHVVYGALAALCDLRSQGEVFVVREVVRVA